MRVIDTLTFCWQTLFKQKFKSLMLFLSVSIGVVSVVLLTGLGEGGRMFVLGEFSSLGNQTLVMVPGKKQTEGGLPPLTGQSSKPISLDDAATIYKLNNVSAVAPLVVGNSLIQPKGEQQSPTNQLASQLEVLVAGSTNELLDIMSLKVIQGKGLSDKAWQQAAPQILLGWQLKEQLFANQNAVGQWLKLAGRRYQVIGVVRSSGSNLSLNFNKMAIIPVLSGLSAFNQEGLFRVFIKVKHRDFIANTKQQVVELMNARQNGIAEITLISQNAMLASFDNVMVSLNLAVAGIGVISLLVAGILIMNVTLISISQRVKEIGLLRAIGASPAQIRRLFLTEASLIAFVGTAIGIAISLLLLLLLRIQFPSVPFQAPLWAILASAAIAIGCSLAFAWLPANKAAKLSIVNALSGHQAD